MQAYAATGGGVSNDIFPLRQIQAGRAGSNTPVSVSSALQTVRVPLPYPPKTGESKSQRFACIVQSQVLPDS